jgi:signal transduction histidine kinase
MQMHWWWFALGGAALGYAYELRRSGQANRRTQEEINSAYLQTARDEVNARRELFALTQRQKVWGHLMEHKIVDRDDMLQQVAAELRELHSQRLVRLRGDARELGSPISRIRADVQALRASEVSTGAKEELLNEIEDQVSLMDHKLKAISGMTSPTLELLDFSPEPLAIGPLVDGLRKRLRALVHSRDVRVSVFAVREAPELVRIDHALFNRVIDNLLVNAANWTENGSIIVEISGTPGFLTIKISDTGVGFPEHELGRLFRPVVRQVDGYSYGAGLSVVVELLGRIGGKLEVMTRQERGSTFWAHFPVDMPGAGTDLEVGDGAPPEELDKLVDKVVSIRRFGEG